MLSTVLLVAAVLLVIGLLPIVIVTFQNRLTLIRGVGLAAVCLLLSFMALVASINADTGENVIDIAIGQTFGQMEAAISGIPSEMWQNFGMDGQQAEQMQGALLQQLRSLRDLYTVLFPSLMILMILLVTYAFFMIVKNVLLLFRRKVPVHPLFSELLLPRGAGIALVVSFGGAALFGSSVGNAFLNLVVLIMGVAACCGLSLADFYLRRRIPFSPLRILVYLVGGLVLSTLSSILIYGFIFVALFDSFRDFRKLRTGEDCHGEQQ